MNSNDRRLNDIIHRTLYHGLLDDFSHAVADAALQFFIRLADRVDRLSPQTLIDIAQLCRDHPADWQRRALETAFRKVHRRVLTPIDPIPVLPKRLGNPKWLNQINWGRFPEIARDLPSHSMDLILTSPPYTLQRKRDYDSVSEQDYPQYTMNWMREAKRLLKPFGSVVIIIKPHLKDGKQSLYVLKTVTALIADGWLRIATSIWHKTDPAPVGSAKRPRQSYEWILWFSLTNDPACDPRASGRWSERIGRVNVKGWFHPSSGGIRGGVARVTDVISTTAGSGMSRDDLLPHPSKHPIELYQRLIEMLSPPRSVVLDPFMGSGTAAVAAITTGRRYVGYDSKLHYVEMARGRVNRLRQRPAVHSNSD